MFGARWQLFRLLGIPVSLDISWIVILVLLTWTLVNLFAETVPDLTLGSYWLMGLLAALGFFGCIVLHELGHAVVARALGIPIRGITLFLFGGVAELQGEPRSARDEFLVAIAGPVVSVVLGGVFWLLAELDWIPAVRAVLEYLAVINIVVLVFNMVPAFPLDGGRVLRSILWGLTGKLRRSTYQASMLGRGFAWLLVGLGVLHVLAGLLVQGLWLGLIGLFLNMAAQAGYQQILVREMLKGEPVARFMNREPIVVPPNLNLRHWVEDYVYRYHRKMFPVSSNGHLDGVIRTDVLGRFPRTEWDQHTVGEAMTADVEPVSIRPEADALEALEKMQRTGSSRLLVRQGDQLVGIVSLKDLLRFLNMKLELEGEQK